ncbi:hypothetical protein V5799_013544 [Amblyomma americanum]|uniref:Uncharacterized protein n=1 Tax=Amblyomma americanum TaxID=6943 RepID=A0AAQ4E5K9_AMBAM
MVVHAPERDTEEGSHEGIFGEFLFRIDTLGAQAMLDGTDDLDYQLQPLGSAATRCSCRWLSSAAHLQRRRGNEPAAASSGPASVLASFAGAYGELAPAEFVEQFVHRQPHHPSVGINGSAGLRRAPPGLRKFRVALHVTEAIFEGNAATSRCMEEATCGAALVKSPQATPLVLLAVCVSDLPPRTFYDKTRIQLLKTLSTDILERTGKTNNNPRHCLEYRKYQNAREMKQSGELCDERQAP